MKKLIRTIKNFIYRKDKIKLVYRDGHTTIIDKAFYMVCCGDPNIVSIIDMATNKSYC